LLTAIGAYSVYLCLNFKRDYSPNIWIAPEGGNFRNAEARQCATEKMEQIKPG